MILSITSGTDKAVLRRRRRRRRNDDIDNSRTQSKIVHYLSVLKNPPDGRTLG
jgi:hypothetical protein